MCRRLGLVASGGEGAETFPEGVLEGFKDGAAKEA
jgi:hypothetical protein